jgi:hypothetical protein
MNNVGDSDALAAEYVLGTLDSDEREQARSLLSTDETFATNVKLWERRFGELHLMVEPVEPDPRLWERVKAKLPPVEQDMEVKPVESAAPEPPPIPSPQSQVSSPTIVPAPGPEAPPSGAERALEELAAPPAEAPLPPLPVGPPLSPSPPPLPAEAAVPAPSLMRAALAAREEAAVRWRLAGWRALALLMTLVVLAIAGLLAAWRFAPDRVPPALRPIELMRLVGVSLPSSEPSRPAPPPESQFDE